MSGFDDDPVDPANVDDRLRAALEAHGVSPVEPGPVPHMSHPKVRLGQKLFFDKALSGNGDIACATCHHPGLGTSDGLPLSIGAGGLGLGPVREMGEADVFIPRNSPDIWNRGAEVWETMFWDGRVHGKPGYFGSPAGVELPEGLESILAVQAMFHVTSRDEMRGHAGENEIADLATLPEIWAALTERILSYGQYQELFAAAYPQVKGGEFGFQHVANALAAFEIAAFTRLDSPFDRYLAGDDDALDAQEKRGAELFFGSANCGSCHRGPLLTDQKTHVLAVPQLGPGKGTDAPLDTGRYLATGEDIDRYAFRTPPLRNVELTGPYFHSGVYSNLGDVIRHHLDPVGMAQAYQAADHVAPAVAETWLNDPEFTEDCMSRVDANLVPTEPLDAQDVEDLVVFLLALTDPSCYDLSELVPDEVPSGLDVDRLATP